MTIAHEEPSSKTASLIFMLVQAFLVLFIAIVSLKLYRYDLKIPFNYGGDSIVILMYIKGLLQDGWPTVISHLSAPFYYPGASFPMLTSVDWSVMKFISFFTNEVGLILNLFWLSTLVFSSWSASYSLYQLGLTRALAGTGGVLYAFLPFALMRNVGHMNLVYYLVPLICLLVFVVVSKGKYVRNAKQATIIGLLACALQGFNYIYYSFFAVILICIAAAISFNKAAGYKQLLLPFLAVLLVTASAALNLVPAFTSISANGNPPEMNYKSPREAEYYGAKIRRMILPHPDNTIRPLAIYAQNDKDADFPIETENVTVRLGLFGAFGLLLLLFVALRQLVGVRAVNELSILSALSIAIVLIITVGGFGAVINILTVPDIRAYNRFSVFLSFYTIAALSLWFHKMGLALNQLRRSVIYGLFFGLAVFSLYDQLLDGKPLVSRQKEDTARAVDERRAVEKLEEQLQKGTSILQLPFTGYPLNLSSNKMEYYDHARPYLWSNDLRWSWPSFTLRHRAWQATMSNKQGVDLINAAIISGFQAIWIDRFAYNDNGEKLINSLAQGKVTAVDIASNRFAVLDLRGAEADLRASLPKDSFKQLAADLLGPEVVVEWGKGFYQEEKNPEGKYFHWSKDHSMLAIRNIGNETVSICVSFILASVHPGTVEMSWAGSSFKLAASTEGRYVKFPMTLGVGEVSKFKFKAGVERLYAPDDLRRLYFYLIDFTVNVLESVGSCEQMGS